MRNSPSPLCPLSLYKVVLVMWNAFLLQAISHAFSFPPVSLDLISVWNSSCSYWQDLYIISLRFKSAEWIQLPHRCLKHDVVLSWTTASVTQSPSSSVICKFMRFLVEACCCITNYTVMSSFQEQIQAAVFCGFTRAVTLLFILGVDAHHLCTSRSKSFFSKVIVEIKLPSIFCIS